MPKIPYVELVRGREKGIAIDDSRILRLEAIVETFRGCMIELRR